MDRSRTKSFLEGKLPVIIFPTSLSFFSDDTSSHQQTLTLYNPYDFSLKFKVLSNARDKYKVIDSEGILKPRCSIDITFKHRDVCKNNENVQDKFRIQVSELGNSAVYGRKDVASILRPTSDKAPSSGADDDFKSLPLHCTQPVVQQQHVPESIISSHRQAELNTNHNWYISIVALLCLFVSLLPFENEESMVPWYLRVTQNQKYIAIYILGLLTTKLLRIS